MHKDRRILWVCSGDQSQSFRTANRTLRGRRRPGRHRVKTWKNENEASRLLLLLLVALQLLLLLWPLRQWSIKPSVSPSNSKFLNTLFEEKSNLMQLFFNCADRLHWRQAGFGKLPENISQEISVTEFIGPNGIFENPNVRIGLLLQSPEIHYPRHWHKAEELYYIISGTAKWATDDEKEKPYQPGNFVHHMSGQTHNMTTCSEPLLALWGWTGDIDGASYSI